MEVWAKDGADGGGMTKIKNNQSFFGAIADKARIQGLFGRVAPAYDRMNDLMSLGLHRCWKDTFVSGLPLDRLPASQGRTIILDVASGTGDIGVRIQKRLVSHLFLTKNPLLLISDLNEPMLRVGLGRVAGAHPVIADALHLPFVDRSVSLYTVAFGLRNMASTEGSLEEAFRILVPGGFFYCLEFSEIASPWLSGLYEMYGRVIPSLGSLFAKDGEAYQYLVKSIQAFPGPQLLEALVQDQGFTDTGFRLLSGGLVAIHWGRKPS